MRPAPPPLLPVFRSRLVGDLLALILLDPSKRWTAEELADRTGAPYPTVTKELRRLGDAGILKAESVGRTRLVAADPDNLYFRPLTELVGLAFGPPLVIAEEFEKVTGIEDLYIYGSWAAREAGEPGATPHDVDVLVLGGPDRDEVYEAATRAQHRLGREVNTTLRTLEQWRTAEDAFARQVRSSPMLPVPGPWRTYAEDDAEMEEGRGDRRAASRGAPSRARRSRS
ncbi:MAG: ArsR family transcriptional regulator [Acidimicrobiia bacterium]